MSSRRAVISGVGESPFGTRLGRSFVDLQLTAIDAALADAKLDRGVVQGAFSDGQIVPELLPVDRLQVEARLTGLREVGYFSIGGTGVALAMVHAARLIEQGEIDHALIYFGVDWASRPGGPYGFHLKYPAKEAYERPNAFFGQPVYFAAMAQRYAAVNGIAQEELTKALGHVAVGQRTNTHLRQVGQQKQVMTLADHEASRMISSPLRKFDCCLISDGAGAIVMSEAEVCASGDKQVRIAGWGHAEEATNDEDFYSQSPGLPYISSATEASARAFASAGLGWADIDVMEIYDCFTISVLLQLESIGFWTRGEGVRSLLEHDGLFWNSARGAYTPSNTHGGFLSHAYLLGINHIIEAVRQLRGDAGATQVPEARTGLVTLSPAREHTTLILTNR